VENWAHPDQHPMPQRRICPDQGHASTRSYEVFLTLNLKSELKYGMAYHNS